MKHECEKGRGFLSGVFLLTVSALLTKVTGLLTKVPMMELLGAQGMGYYNAAYEVYAFLFVLATAGLPVALSILISQGRGDRRRILGTATALFALLGGAGCFGLFFGGEALARAIGNSAAGPAMRALAPAVLFVSLAAAVRGYYQGLQDMVPTALSQILEAVGKLAFGLLFATIARRRGWELSAVAAAGARGLSAGTLLSLLYLMGRLWRDGVDHGQKDASQGKRPATAVLGPLLAIALPITLSSGVTTLTRLLDVVLILRRLGGCGYSEAEAAALYGTYSTMAIPLYSMLPMLISSVALPLVPGITRARELGDREGERRMVESAFRLTLLLGVPASLGLSAFSRPILTLLFGAAQTALPTAVPLLSVLGISVLGGCLMTVTHALLQAYGHPRVPLCSLLIGAAIKLTSAWILLARPRIGMTGAPLSTFFCNLTVVVIDLWILRRLLPSMEGIFSLCLRILAASLLSVGGTFVLWRIALRCMVLPRVAILGAIGLCCAMYLALAPAFGVVTWEQLRVLSHRKRMHKSILSR